MCLCIIPNLERMPCKFRHHVPKGASRKPSKKSQASSSSKDVFEEIVTSENSTQTDLPVHNETKDSSMQTEEPVVMTCDGSTVESTQTDNDTDGTATDELDEDPVPAEQDHLCKGNNDIKFHPLIIRHKGVFTDVKGMYFIITKIFNC